MDFKAFEVVDVWYAEALLQLTASQWILNKWFREEPSEALALLMTLYLITSNSMWCWLFYILFEWIFEFVFTYCVSNIILSACVYIRVNSEGAWRKYVFWVCARINSNGASEWRVYTFIWARITVSRNAGCMCVRYKFKWKTGM